MALNLGEISFYGQVVGGVALHGLVDCLSPKRLLCYVPVLLPFEGYKLKVIFVAASVVHIAHDVSTMVSVLLHSIVAAFIFREERKWATAVMLGYMWLIHMPVMIYRAALAGQALSSVAITVSVVIGAHRGTMLLRSIHMIEEAKEEKNNGRKTTHVVIPPLAQRVVVCHVVANLIPA